MAAVVATLVLGACDGVVYVRVDSARTGLGLPVLARSPLLQAAAQATSSELCAAGAVTATADPVARYDATTVADAVEMVSAAPLDPSIADPGQRRTAAVNAAWDGVASSPAVTDPRWDDVGVGGVECADGNLYLTTVFTERPSMPASGRYASYQHTAAQLQEITGLQYGTATDHQGQSQALTLDLFLPPSIGAPRPLAIFVHGGSFRGGAAADFAYAARDFARRGYVAASIDYRVNPTASPSNLTQYAQTILNAFDDTLESVRWLKSQAATYEIDASRIALLGSSAGGNLALMASVYDDFVPGGPLAAYSPEVTATVSTGATLVLNGTMLPYHRSDVPFLLYHYETDNVTRYTAADAQTTCDAQRTAGGTCDLVIQPGAGHTIALAGALYTSGEIGPFLWTQLDLG